MNKNACVLAVLLVLQIPLFSQSIRVNFHIADYGDSIAYIGYHFGSQKYLIDTLEVRNDRFTLDVDDPRTGVYFVYAPNYYFEFILDDRSFDLSTTATGAYRELQVTNSPENQLFKEFQTKMGALQAEQRGLMERLKESSGTDSLEIVSSLKQLTREMDSFRSGLIEDNKNTFMAAFLKLMKDPDVPKMDSIADPGERKKRQYQYYRANFFEPGQLGDSRLLRTPLIHAKVMKYFDEVLVQHPDTLNAELDWFFGELTGEELLRYWLVTFFKKYSESKTMGMDAVMVHLIENYYLKGVASWISEEYEQKLREEVAYVKPNLIGKTAPALVVVDSLDQPFSLNEVSSPLTLLFIYDPDCGHCKKTVKKLEENDQRISELGITVVAVCTTTDIERWKRFVRESNPMWEHVIDPTGRSYFRVSYNVRSTPKLYLLDDQKKIIAKSLEVEQFLDLAERMKK